MSDKKNQVYNQYGYQLAGQKLLITEEAALAKWILLQDKSGCHVDLNIINQKAEEILKARTGVESFLGVHWCRRFARRHPPVLEIWHRLKNKPKEKEFTQIQENSRHPGQKLLRTEEAALAEWVLLQDQCGCPVNLNIIKQKAQEILKARTGEESLLGAHWCRRFARRHPPILEMWEHLKNNHKAEVFTQNQEDSHLFEEVVVKDEFGDYETSAAAEFDDLGSSDTEAFTSQNISELKPVTTDDCNFNFCMSVFNEMSKMNDEQQLDFRTKMQQMIQEVLNKV